MLKESHQFTLPQVEKSTSKEQRFSHAIEVGINEAYKIIGNNFETNATPENNLAYHRATHTYGVVDRTAKILQAIKQANPNEHIVTDRDIALGKFAAAWHDTVQKWDPNIVPDKDSKDQLKRKRKFMANEIDSADLAVAYMKAINQYLGNTFSKRDIQTVRDAIMLTVPNFDITLGTVTQPNFAKYKNNLVVQAVALADLGGGGMEGFNTAHWESDALFMEDNLDFAYYYRTLTQNTERRLAGLRNPEDEEWYSKRMIGWLESQVRFSKGRAQEVQKEIDSMDTKAQQAVHQLFSHYPETIAAMEQFVKQRKTNDFPTWIQDMQTSLANPPIYA